MSKKYKTIRHGENSLQYTILAQNDDFHIEGKLTSGESKCVKPLKSKRSKRRLFITYLGLTFVCTVIVGALVIPFLVSTEFIPNPSIWFLRRNVTLKKNEGNRIEQLVYSNKSELINRNIWQSTENTLRISKTNSKHLNDSTNDSTNRNVISSSTSENFKDLVFSKGEKLIKTSVKPVQLTTEAAVQDLMRHPNNIIPSIMPTSFLVPISVAENHSSEVDQDTAKKNNSNSNKISNYNDMKFKEKILLYNEEFKMKSVPSSTIPKADVNIVDNHNISTSNSNASSHIIQLPFLNSSNTGPALKSVIKCVENKSEIQSSLNHFDNCTKVSKDISPDWLQTSFPYINAVTFFKWIGYNDENRALLPVLLGFTFVGTILILTVCILARKKLMVETARNCSRNIVEYGQEDKTTLLTSNLSDED